MSKSLIALIPSAGVGSRFGGDIPKQYLMINGYSILAHTCHALAECADIKAIAVVLSSEDQYFQYMRLPENCCVVSTLGEPTSLTPIMPLYCGGSSRAESVLNGIQALLENKALYPEDLVLVHDAVRCCIRPSLVEEVYRCGLDHADGALLAVPVVDTLKQVNSDNTIQQTIDRSRLWQAQTPQIFMASTLLQALFNVDLEKVTDEASAVETLGYQPKLVMGERYNIKLTHRDDLPLVEFLLSQKRA